jgi:hypothetical protein
MTTKNTTLHLECILTDTEKLIYSKEMAESVGFRARAEDSLKSFSTQIKAQIAGHDAKINLLAEKLSTGREYREVECEIVKDFKAKTKSFIRKDTGDVARVDELSESDLQTELPV